MYKNHNLFTALAYQKAFSHIGFNVTVLVPIAAQLLLVDLANKGEKFILLLLHLFQQALQLTTNENLSLLKNLWVKA